MIPDDDTLRRVGHSNPYRQGIFRIKDDHECSGFCGPQRIAAPLIYTDDGLAHRGKPLPWLEGS